MPGFNAPMTRSDKSSATAALRLLTKRQAAESLSISVRSVERLLQSRRLTAVRIGASTRIDPNDLEKLIAEAKR